MKPVYKKIFENPVILIKNLNDGSLVVVDSKTNFSILEKPSFEIKSGFRGKISHLDFGTKVLDFSSDGKYFVSVSSDTKESKLVDISAKKVTSKVTRHHGSVSCVGIDTKNRYMFSCGEDGKTFAVDMKSAKLAFTLPIHADAITDIVFSDDGMWVVTAGYDKKVFVFNLESMSQTHKLIGHRSVIVKMQFLNDYRLFSVDKDGNAIIWDLKTSKIIKRLEKIHDTVTQVTKSKDNKFLFIATKLGYVFVYELEEYKLLCDKYIKLSSPITAMEFDEVAQNLIIGTMSCEMYVYFIYSGKEDIEKFLKDKRYEDIYQYIKQNPLLQYLEASQKMEAVWDVTLKKAILLLEKGDKDNAKNILKNFKGIPSKNSIIQKTIAEYEEFDKFVMFAKQGKIALAYTLANKHPMYKNSSIFKSLEANWKKAFLIAQKHMLDPKAKERVREILVPYRGISEKTKLIQELFLQGDVYKRLKIAIGKKDFKLSFELIKQHSFLKEFPEYDMLIQYADNLYIKAQNFLQENDVNSALKIFRILRDFTDFREEAEEAIHTIESKQKFHDAVERDDLLVAYSLLCCSEELQHTKDGKALQEQWDSDFKKANIYAINGDVVGIKKILAKYMNVTSKHKFLVNLFGWAYMAQLEQALRQKKDRSIIEDGIKNYILSFGLTEHIKMFFDVFKKHYPDSKLNLNLQNKGSADMWRPSMIMDSIFG